MAVATSSVSPGAPTELELLIEALDNVLQCLECNVNTIIQLMYDNFKPNRDQC